MKTKGKVQSSAAPQQDPRPAVCRRPVEDFQLLQSSNPAPEPAPHGAQLLQLGAGIREVIIQPLFSPILQPAGQGEHSTQIQGAQHSKGTNPA